VLKLCCKARGKVFLKQDSNSQHSYSAGVAERLAQMNRQVRMCPHNAHDWRRNRTGVCRCFTAGCALYRVSEKPAAFAAGAEGRAGSKTAAA